VQSSLQLSIDGKAANLERLLVGGSIICLRKGLECRPYLWNPKVSLRSFLLARSVALCSSSTSKFGNVAFVVIGTEFSKIVEVNKICCPQGSKIDCFYWWHSLYELAGTVAVCYPSPSLVCGLVESAQVIVLFCGFLSDPVRICTAATVNVHKDVYFFWIHTPHCGSVPAMENPILKVNWCLWFTASIRSLEE
jgi:hypothetical protein